MEPKLLTDAEKAMQIRQTASLLNPLGFCHMAGEGVKFYHPVYDVAVDFSAIAHDKVVEHAVKNIYYGGMDYGTKSAQKIFKNALGL